MQLRTSTYKMVFVLLWSLMSLGLGGVTHCLRLRALKTNIKLNWHEPQKVSKDILITRRVAEGKYNLADTYTYWCFDRPVGASHALGPVR